ncbi:hypothetical protein B5M42_000140 [Paenibacillus athensensis]|uniref:Uncharacterized protein n=1 Tax=Paenibacillus athensensis TaxID=1967502 RepID=A0A4Y8PT09_9BACL|nr:hypothetical protein [Paenibacillus athensensis]MCD1257243.1 hypothetical protein [Paenibacillus athensensis]
MTITLDLPTDWDTLFQEVRQEASIPDCTLTSLNKYHTVVRDMVVDLGKLQQMLKQQGVSPLMVSVYADVVRIPAGLNWTLQSSSLTLFARRIETSDQARITLDFREKANAVLLLYAQEFTAPLQIKALMAGQSEPTSLAISKLDTIGLRISCADNKLQQIPLKSLTAPLTNEGSDLHLMLVEEFMYATVLVNRQPDAAEPMLEWIRACAVFSPAFNEMVVQSASLLVILKSQPSNALFVPVLSPQVYKDTAAAYTAVALEYERQYERFSAQESDLNARIEAAELMLKDSVAQSQFNQQLIQQCDTNLGIARKAVDAAMTRFKMQQLEMQRAAGTFALGLEVWKTQQQWKAALAIIGAILDFASSIATMAATAGAAAPAAAAEAAAAAATAAKNAVELGDAMKNLSKIIEALAKVYDMAIKIQQAATSLAQGQSMADKLAQMSLDGDQGELSGTVFWDQYQLQADANMKPAIDNNIGGASDYQLQMDILALYGKDLTTKQVALIQMSEQLVRLKLQQQVDDARQARLEDYVKQLKAGQAPTTEMMQQFYLRYLMQKMSLFVALENYMHAYKYWALQDSTCSCSITEKIEALTSGLAQIQNDYNRALEHFNPHPQAFQNMPYAITAAGKLEAFKQNGSVSFTIGALDSVFADFNRVRVDLVRVRLAGARCASPIYVELRTTGVYTDRWQNKPTTPFVSQGLQLGFIYDPANGSVLLDGRLADETKFAYFVPTPFTEWRVSLATDSQYNRQLDLSGLTGIELEFSGSLIAKMN